MINTKIIGIYVGGCNRKQCVLIITRPCHIFGKASSRVTNKELITIYHFKF